MCSCLRYTTIVDRYVLLIYHHYKLYLSTISPKLCCLFGNVSYAYAAWYVYLVVCILSYQAHPTPYPSPLGRGWLFCTPPRVQVAEPKTVWPACLFRWRGTGVLVRAVRRRTLAHDKDRPLQAHSECRLNPFLLRLLLLPSAAHLLCPPPSPPSLWHIYPWTTNDWHHFSSSLCSPLLSLVSAKCTFHFLSLTLHHL